MDHVNFSKDLVESIPDYRKHVILMFLIKTDFDLITECGFLKNDIIRLRLDFKKIISGTKRRILRIY